MINERIKSEKEFKRLQILSGKRLVMARALMHMDICQRCGNSIHSLFKPFHNCQGIDTQHLMKSLKKAEEKSMKIRKAQKASENARKIQENERLNKLKERIESQEKESKAIHNAHLEKFRALQKEAKLEKRLSEAVPDLDHDEYLKLVEVTDSNINNLEMLVDAIAQGVDAIEINKLDLIKRLNISGKDSNYIKMIVGTIKNIDESLRIIALDVLLSAAAWQLFHHYTDNNSEEASCVMQSVVQLGITKVLKDAHTENKGFLSSASSLFSSILRGQSILEKLVLNEDIAPGNVSEVRQAILDNEEKIAQDYEEETKKFLAKSTEEDNIKNDGSYNKDSLNKNESYSEEEIITTKKLNNGIAGDGMTDDDVNLNLQNMIKYMKPSNIYVHNSIINPAGAAALIKDWQNDTVAKHSKALLSIITLTNSKGEKHAVLVSAKKLGNAIAITVVDSLSSNNTEFNNRPAA